MGNFLYALRTSHYALEWLGWIITVIAVTGVVLNNGRRRECFYLWLVSNTLSACVHLAVGLWALAVRDVIFLVLAVHGLRCWKAASSQEPVASSQERPCRSCRNVDCPLDCLPCRACFDRIERPGFARREESP